MPVIEIPSIRSDEAGYRRLIKITNEIREDPLESYSFDFKHCSRFDHNAAALFGLLSCYVKSYNALYRQVVAKRANVPGGVLYLINTMTDVVRSRLEENNFLSHVFYGDIAGVLPGGYIGYREHGAVLDADGIAHHLTSEWLTDERLRISEDLKAAIVGKIFEIYMNAYGHGSGRLSNYSLDNMIRLGAVSCGEFDKKSGHLKLCVVDFGGGVCKAVKKFLGQESMSDEDALKWALQAGNSTHTDISNHDMPRGLGFDLLRDFVCLNKGRIDIYTNNCHAIADGMGGYRVSDEGYAFDGTIVDITINCDDRYYRFYKESDDSSKEYF